MGWRDAKEAAKAGFDQSTKQLADRKISYSEMAKSAKNVEKEVEENGENKRKMRTSR